MKLARVHGAGDMRVDEVPLPVAGPRDVVVRVLACGICGSDLGYVAQGGLGGEVPLAEPLPLGHEFAGIVESVGSDVTDIRVGMRCAVNPDDDYIGGGGPTGAMAPFILIPNARIGSTIFPIPDHLPAEKAALAEPLSVSLHGVDIAAVGPGSKVAIVGAGPIGLSAIIAARHRGATDIVAIDLSDSRLERARQLGATRTINPQRESVKDALGEVHGTGVRFGTAYVGTDTFIDTAGSAKALEELFDVAKYRSKFVIIALYKKPFPVSLFKLMANEITLVGSIAVERHAQFGECVDLLASGAIDVEPLISHRVDFERIDEAFGLAANVDSSAKVMLTFPGTA